MKYAENKHKFFELLEKSMAKTNVRVYGRRINRDLILNDISLFKTGDNIPIPIINFVYGNLTKLAHNQLVFCQFFWIGQAYSCWLTVKITEFRNLPEIIWSPYFRTFQNFIHSR